MPAAIVDAMVEDLLVEAHGVLYSVEIEAEDLDLDWLDRTILDVAETPCRVDELIKCFGLPRRMMEDAIGRLMEQHLLLLNVSHATVRASRMPAHLHAHARRESLLVWQDHSTGTLLPWDMIKPWCPREHDDEPGGHPLLHVQGGPPRRTLLEMSDAELLSALERYRKDWGWAERIPQRERVRMETMRVPAGRLPSGQVSFLAGDGMIVPWVLTRRWVVEGQALGVGSIPTVDLPRAWSDVVGQWSQDTRTLVDSLVKGSATDVSASLDAALAWLRATLEARVEVEYSNQGMTYVRERLQRARRRVVICSPAGENTFGDALSLARAVEHLRPTVQCVIVSAAANKRQRSKAADAGIRVETTGRGDVECVLIDDRELIFGGMRAAQNDVVRVTSSRPILAFVAWLPEGARDEATPLGRVDSKPGTEGAIGRLASFNDALREIARTVSRSDAEADKRPPPQPGSANAVEGGPQGEVEATPNVLQRLKADQEQLEGVLLGMMPAPVPVLIFDLESLGVAIANAGDRARILVRDAASPLALSAPSGAEVVVVASSPPAQLEAGRWLQRAGIADIVVIDQVVVLGFCGRLNEEDPPPFFAVNAPSLAYQLRALTDRPAPHASRVETEPERGVGEPPRQD